MRVSGLICAGIAALMLPSQAFSWDAVTPASATGLSRRLPFSGALVWDIGASAQFVIGCDGEERFTAYLALPRIEPLFVNGGNEPGRISIRVGTEEVWSSATEPPRSYSSRDVTLVAQDHDGVVPLLKRIANVSEDIEVMFQGVYSWTVIARPPRTESDVQQAAQLEEVCPSLQSIGLSQGTGFGGAPMTFEAFLLDRWLYRGRPVEISGCRIEVVGGASIYDTSWNEHLSAFAALHGLHATAAYGEAVIWQDKSGNEEIAALASEFVSKFGGTITNPDGAANGSPLRLKAPPSKGIAQLPSDETFRCAWRGGTVPVFLKLSSETLDPSAKTWAAKSCLVPASEASTDDTVCSRVSLTGKLDADDTLKLNNANIVHAQ